MKSKSIPGLIPIQKNRLTKNELAYIDECGHWAGTVDDHPDNCYVQLELELDEEEDDEK